MRFPFFATNRRLDYWVNQHIDSTDIIGNDAIDNRKQIYDLYQKVLVLEGRVNKLEPNKAQGKGSKYYTRREWSRMNKLRRMQLLRHMDPREKKYTLKIEEAIKSGRKKGKQVQS